MGYALVELVDLDEDADKPRLILPSFHRPLSTKQLRKLRTIAGDGSGLRTRDHENAVIISIPSRCIDRGHLSPSPYGPHRPLNFLPGAKKETMVLLAGHHRMKVSEDLSKMHRLEITKLEGKLDRATAGGQQRKVRQLSTQIKNMKAALEYQIVWLAMIHDKGTQVHDCMAPTSLTEPPDKIEANEQLYATALFKLMTNNRVAPVLESEAYQLATLFRTAYKNGKRVADEVMGYATTLENAKKDTYRRLAIRGGGFCNLSCRPERPSTSAISSPIALKSFQRIRSYGAWSGPSHSSCGNTSSSSAATHPFPARATMRRTMSTTPGLPAYWYWSRC